MLTYRPHLVPYRLQRKSTFFSLTHRESVIPILSYRLGVASRLDLTKYSLHFNEVAAVAVKMPMIDDGFEALLEPFYNGKKLTDPVSTKDDKFQLLPAFLKVKGS